MLTAELSAASDLATATAAVPEAEPSRPASTVPEPCGASPGREPGDGGALVPCVVAQRAAGDDQRGVGRADALVAVGDEAGVAQRRQHGVALRVVDDRRLRDPG